MVFEYIAKYIAAHFDIDEDDITKSTTFEQLHAHEEDITDMLFAASRRFDFIPDENELYGLEDVGDLTDLIDRILK